jgi:hypothetical protein
MFRLILFIFLTSFTLESSAQLCAGSLGDPVATIDFGNGSSGFGQPLPSGKTNYSFLYNSCPVDGQYTITSATLNCFSRSWHSITNDHTPDDIGGFFMLVNASVGPGVFYVDTVNTLCDNTTYEFSSYIINMTNSTSCGGNAITPNLTFTIETESGQLLTKYNTGNIAIQANPDWKQYGTYITTPPNAGKIIIKIVPMIIPAITISGLLDKNPGDFNIPLSDIDVWALAINYSSKSFKIFFSTHLINIFNYFYD